MCEVGLLDPERKRLEAYREPGAGGYRRTLERGGEDSLAPETLPALSVRLRKILE